MKLAECPEITSVLFRITTLGLDDFQEVAIILPKPSSSEYRLLPESLPDFSDLECRKFLELFDL